MQSSTSSVHVRYVSQDHISVKYTYILYISKHVSKCTIIAYLGIQALLTRACRRHHSVVSTTASATLKSQPRATTTTHSYTQAVPIIRRRFIQQIADTRRRWACKNRNMDNKGYHQPQLSTNTKGRTDTTTTRINITVMEHP